MALRLTHKADGKILTALLQIALAATAVSSVCPRVTARSASSRWKISSGLYLDRIFPGHVVIASGVIPHPARQRYRSRPKKPKILVRLYETLLKRRRRGSVILRLKCSDSMPVDLRRFIAGHLNMGLRQPFIADGLLGLNETKQLILDERPDLQGRAVRFALSRTQPRSRRRLLRGNQGQGRIIVHHPYESFDVVVQYLRQAAADPGRGGDQADPLPHQQGQPHRPRAP